MVSFTINIPQMLAYIYIYYQHHGSYGYRKDSILRFSWEPRTDTTCPLCRLMSSRFHSVRWTWMSHLAPCYVSLFPVWRFPEMGVALNHPLMVFNRLFHEINQACLDIFGYPPLMERWNPYIMMNGLVFLGYLFHQKPQICQKRDNSMEIPV